MTAQREIGYPKPRCRGLSQGDNSTSQGKLAPRSKTKYISQYASHIVMHGNGLKLLTR
jgi:hypothetical protein